MPDRFKLIAEVYLLFRRGDEILLSKRANTGYRDGDYGLVSGHVDGGEPLALAACREALEEAGVRISAGDLTLKTVMHRRREDERIGFFFEPAGWSGDIVNAEPHKCERLAWFSLDALPANTIGYVREAIRCAGAGVAYADWWDRDD
ncbi:MAG TPA: NUDIX domain-containing protein [Caulobacteraceae bacterium]|nr:NUDIX domain-containing protein [Caulobacteraceae bacterium]